MKNSLTKKHFLYLRLIGFFSVIFSLMACQFSGPKETITPIQIEYRISILSDENSNLDAQKKEMPLKVRAFKLMATTEFMNADFFSLQTNGAATLGSNLSGQEQFFLHKNNRLASMLITKNPDFISIGFIAEYQKLDGKIWRTSVKLPTPPPVKNSFFKQFLPKKTATYQVDILVRATEKGLTYSTSSVKNY